MIKIRIDRAIESYEKLYGEKISQRKLAMLVAPDVEDVARQAYFIKMKNGNFGPKASVNLNIVERICQITGIEIEELFEITYLT